VEGSVKVNHQLPDGTTVSKTINRSKQAGAYADKLCNIWPVVLWAAYKATPPRYLPPTLTSLSNGGSVDLSGLTEWRNRIADKVGQAEIDTNTSNPEGNRRHQPEILTEKLQGKAKSYMDHCLNNPQFNQVVLIKAVELGDALLFEAGNIETAAEAINKIWSDSTINPMKGILEPCYQKKLEQNHARYLREIAEKGAPERRKLPAMRIKAKSHNSIQGYEMDILEKAYKDTQHYGVILCSRKHESVFQGATEAPAGRVPKKNPDRTISSEGRTINDMRSANLAGH